MFTGYIRGAKLDPVAMAIIITEECINCGACEPECPNNAIYEGGVEWRLSDGTSAKDFDADMGDERLRLGNPEHFDRSLADARICHVTLPR